MQALCLRHRRPFQTLLFDMSVAANFIKHADQSYCNRMLLGIELRNDFFQHLLIIHNQFALSSALLSFAKIPTELPRKHLSKLFAKCHYYGP